MNEEAMKEIRLLYEELGGVARAELDKLISWLEKIKTHDAIIDFFENEIDTWRQHNMNYAAPTLHFYPVDAQLAFRKQLDIGWFLTLCGFLSPDLLQL